jgi:dihydrolipoamide dehydrogenase
MKMFYDVAVLGSGPGGYICALRASQLGLKTVCFEESDRLGGASLYIGSIPSKTLMQAFDAYKKIVEEAAKKGMPLVEEVLEVSFLRKKKSHIIEELAGSIKSLFHVSGVDVIHARAHLADAHTIRAISKGEDVHEVHAESIVLATGSYPIELPFLPFDENRVLSSTGALLLETIPKQLVIIGAGFVGAEFASAYSRLGSEVIVIDAMPSLCMEKDATMREALYTALRNQGIKFYFNTQVINAQKKGEEGAILLRLMLPNGKEELLETEKVLVAI